MSLFFSFSFYLKLTQAGSTICHLHFREQYTVSFEDLLKVSLPFHIKQHKAKRLYVCNVMKNVC